MSIEGFPNDKVAPEVKPLENDAQDRGDGFIPEQLPPVASEAHEAPVYNPETQPEREQTRKRGNGAIIALAVSTLVAGVIAYKTFSKEKAPVTPEQNDASTSHETDRPTVELDENSIIILAKRSMTVAAAKQRFEVRTVDLKEANRQFPVLLELGANANTNQQAVDMQGGDKKKVAETNKALLPELLEIAGIAPDSEAFNIVEEFNQDNLKDGTFADFKRTGNSLTATRYLQTGVNNADVKEVKEFTISGDPTRTGQKWNYGSAYITKQK